MNVELIRRQELSRRVADALESHPDILAVLVFGSVASGEVDAASDVDIFVICHDVPPVQTRTALMSSLGLRLEYTTHEGELFGVVDQLNHQDGLRLSLHFQRQDWLEAIVTEVLAGAVTTQNVPFRPYTFLGLLHQSQVLLDKRGLVAGWLERSRTYPARLKKNLLNAFMPQLRDHAADLSETAARNLSLRTFLFYLNWGVDALTGVLLALSEQYDPASKRFESSVLPLLAHKPTDFDRRLHDILVGPFDEEGMLERARAFQTLADEVIELTKR